MNKVIDFIKENIRIIILVLVIVIFLVVVLTKESMQKKTTYTVIEGTIENSEETNLYVLKKESLVDFDSSQAVTAIIDQGKRTSKNEAIATYQNESYEEYLKQIEDIDKQIQSLVKDMPATHSTDIANLDAKILKYSMQAQNTTSYVKMQEYKTKLDELTFKKINIIANSSPEGSAIRELVNQRNNLVKLSKESSNTILSDTSGIVTYKLDGAEGSYEFREVESYDAEKLDELINEFDSNLTNEFGIKIVDNFKTYLLVKTRINDFDDLIEENRRYKLRIFDLENKTITATLIKKEVKGEYDYSLFKIENEVDSFADLRKLSCEVIWKTNTGMAVPMNAIYTDVSGYKYVLMVYGTEYVKVPINITSSSDSIAIVENLPKDQVTKLGLNPTFKLELYDELVIQKEGKN